ncbi:MAG: ATP-binding protein, partial [Proteobacteria bacterium]|nr:ATP-binding protein [Pseudomonadota bacterium]
YLDITAMGKRTEVKRRTKKILRNSLSDMNIPVDSTPTNAPAEKNDTESIKAILSELENESQESLHFDGVDGDISFQSTRERFECVCNLIKGLVVRYIRLHSERLLTDTGAVRASTPSVREVLQTSGIFVDDTGDNWLDACYFPQLNDIEVQLSRFRALIDKRIEATYEAGKMSLLVPETIQAQFQLTPTELLLLCAVTVPQLNADIARLYKFATGLETTIFPGWFYADLLAESESETLDILSLLDPSRPLRMFSLIDVGTQADWGNLTPILQAPLSVPNRIASFLVGGETDRRVPYAELWQPKGETYDLIFPPEFVKKQVLRMQKRRKSRAAMFGTRGFGRRSIIREYATEHNLNILEIDLSLISPDETPQSFVKIAGLWFREARLCGAILLFRYDNVSPELNQLLEQSSGHFRQMVEMHPGGVAILASKHSALLKKMFGDYSEIVCPTPPRSMQCELWTRALSPLMSGEMLTDTVNYISSSYCLTMGEIQNTIQTCSAQNGDDGITGPALAETLRTTRGQELEGLAELKATPLGLSDIVLSNEIRNTIEEILNFARYSEMVSVDWGFSKMSTATGLGVLFSGPPGTGKTLTAGVIAHELKRALYVVDISRVVDKYIGETEKRLAKIFQHAQSSQAIILFDEADSLFAKRTNVKSSNDRYANLEVNYLLQRLESYNGVCILTTNALDSLDEALARRIQFKVGFKMPDEKERAKLWSVLLPEKAREGDIDFDRLGEGFEMSGGHIKNAVFRACIQAASRGCKVDTEMLWDAGVHEFREMGHVIRDLDSGFD